MPTHSKYTLEDVYECPCHDGMDVRGRCFPGRKTFSTCRARYDTAHFLAHNGYWDSKLSLPAFLQSIGFSGQDLEACRDYIHQQDLPYECVLCGQDFQGFGNNPFPLAGEGRCCDGCNASVVAARFSQAGLAARLAQAGLGKVSRKP